MSLSPHIHSGDSIEKNMYGVLIALIPAFICSVIFFGWGAILVTAVSVASCLIFEYAIQKYLLRQTPTIWDGSAIITGVLLAFNLPSCIPLWIVAIGALVAIGVGKMSFGGLGNNIFNPALVGRVFLLISFPVQMTTWPTPQGFATTDAVTGATPLAIVKAALAGNGAEASSSATAMSQGPQSVSEILASHGISMQDVLYGHIGGSLGEVAAIALLLGFAYMLIRRIITWHIPVAIFATVIVFTGILHLADPEQFAGPLFHLFTGGLMLGAIFMATDYVTSPMTHKGMWIYGIGIGVLTVLIRVFGSYPEGMSFAILIMNGFTPLINRYCKPQKF